MTSPGPGGAAQEAWEEAAGYLTEVEGDLTQLRLGAAAVTRRAQIHIPELSAPFHYLKVAQPAHDQCHVIINQNPNISLV
jgi:hypothetical protein